MIRKTLILTTLAGLMLTGCDDFECCFPSFIQLNRYNTTSATIFLPAVGYRVAVGGGTNYIGTHGDYWSSTPNGANAWYLNCRSGISEQINNQGRALGNSVRCVKE